MTSIYLSAQEIVSALAERKLSAVEALQESIARIAALDKKLNAVVVKDFERAHATAKGADDALAQGKRTALLGLPMTVKESFFVTGLTTSRGHLAFKNWIPEEDALSIQRLKAVGANIFGKTNVPVMLQDWQTYNAIYGTTNNPWDVRLTPGGSSGGSAVALAAGYVALELGSDLAGSLRLPAHFCGVCAHKPSQDLIPTRGSQPPTVPASFYRVDLAVSGPMARHASDLALGLSILAGPDPLVDGMGYQLALPKPQQNKLQDFRVLVIDEHPLCPTDSRIQSSLSELATNLEKAGVQVTRFNKTSANLATITENYALFLAAFGSASLPDPEFAKLQEQCRQLAPEDNSLHANLLRGCVFSHRDYVFAMRKRSQLRAQWLQLYNEFDVILTPVSPTLAFPHDHTEDTLLRKLQLNGTSIPYEYQFIWISMASLFGLPATVVPMQQQAGLPVGVQIIGNYLHDYTTIKFAELMEQEFGGFIKPALT